MSEHWADWMIMRRQHIFFSVGTPYRATPC